MATINLTIEEAVEHLRKHFQLTENDEINIFHDVVCPDGDLGLDSSTTLTETSNGGWSYNFDEVKQYPQDQMVDIVLRDGTIHYDVSSSDVDWMVYGNDSDVVAWRIANYVNSM